MILKFVWKNRQAKNQRKFWNRKSMKLQFESGPLTRHLPQLGELLIKFLFPVDTCLPSYHPSFYQSNLSPNCRQDFFFFPMTALNKFISGNMLEYLSVLKHSMTGRFYLSRAKRKFHRMLLVATRDPSQVLALTS